MIAKAAGWSPLQSRLIEGVGHGTILLLPLTQDHREMPDLVRFCRRIARGSPVLAARTDLGPGWGSDRCGEPAGDMLLAMIAGLVERTVTRYRLGLMPVVAVGHAVGADLALRFLLNYDALLGACILLRPLQWAGEKSREGLNGMPVLLGRTVNQEAVGTVGRQVCHVLRESGADVVCERVLRRRSPGGRDDVIARVFLSTLYGHYAAPQSESA